MDKTYRIAVIGAGARGEMFARQLHRGRHRASLFGVCDVDADRLEKFCNHCELGGVARFTSVRELVSHGDLDAVICTTPDFTHADVAVEALEAGKAVYVEKPLAHSAADCYRIIEAERRTGQLVYVGFNLRALVALQKLREIVRSGVLGQIIFVSGLEVLSREHGASYMRRFHRHSGQSGGLLNHKSSHDLDIMQWLVGHEHRVVRVSSFGGTNVFTPEKQPAATCGTCPPEIHDACAYRAAPGFVFPIDGPPLYPTAQPRVYGGDLCVYSPDKDIVDNQVVILEWDHGVRGSYALQMFQNEGRRQITVLGEKGTAEWGNGLRVTLSDGGDVTEYRFGARRGGHGGADGAVLRRFVHALDTGSAADSGTDAGLAATLVALKADEARLTGGVVAISPQEYR